MIKLTYCVKLSDLSANISKLGCQTLKSGLDSLSEKAGMTIVDDSMHVDVKKNGQ